SSSVCARPGTDSAAIAPSIIGSGRRTWTPGIAGSTSTSELTQSGWAEASRIAMCPPIELPMRLTGRATTVSMNSWTRAALSATVFVTPVEHRERGQRGEDVFGLLQRAARTQRVGGGQPLGQGAARFVVFPVGGWKVSVQGGVGRPGAAGLLEVLAEGVARVP